MVEIGAGGGSIARVNHLGVVQVGPDSAGSSPGPAAYGNGGELPTVTDAHALIGTVTPERFAVGKVGLRPELARQAIQAHLAGQAGLDAPQAAQAIIEVVSENMANAARVHASEPVSYTHLQDMPPQIYPDGRNGLVVFAAGETNACLLYTSRCV